jgi:hypothetical protein
MNNSPQTFYPGAVLDSTKFVVDNAEHVFIDQEKAKQYADSLNLNAMHSWLLDAPVDLAKLPQDELLNYIFVFTSLSFSYWGSPDYFYVYEGKKHKTSWGLSAALYVGHKAGLPILDIRHLSQITDAELGKIINKDSELPLFSERGRILRENCSVLREKFDCSVLRLIESVEHDAGTLLAALYDNFPAIRDEAEYKERKVFFMKKAQIFIADIDRLFEAPIGKLNNVEVLTAAADYRLPQLMRHYGILRYSDELANIIDSEKEIAQGTVFEVEIRAATIWANEYIRRFAEKKNSVHVKGIEVNDYIWLQAKAKNAEFKPFHRTRTVMY